MQGVGVKPVLRGSLLVCRFQFHFIPQLDGPDGQLVVS
jgi:hypothetical protein